jgi:hypothetical protein
VVGAGRAGRRELVPHALGGGERLVGLTRGDQHGRGERTKPLPIERADGPVGHAERARGGAVEGPHGDEALADRSRGTCAFRTNPRFGQQTTSDENGVVAGGRFGPQQPGVGDLFVEPSPLRVQRLERVAVACQRALGAVVAAYALPRDLRRDLDQRGRVACKCRAHARGENAAAAQRDHVAGVGALQQPAHDLLLRRAKRLLPVKLELTGNRLPEALHQQRVAIDRRAPAQRGQAAGERRLACAHEADQDERHVTALVGSWRSTAPIDPLLVGAQRSAHVIDVVTPELLAVGAG